ncbi:MAG: hypothetical protein ACJA0E_001387, partial [Bermanella sp.]
MFKRVLTGLVFTFFCINTSYAVNSDDDSPVQSEYSANTFYALLVAEMAGQRQLYDLALGNYLLEAHR